MLLSTFRGGERNRHKNSGTGRGCWERACPGGISGSEPGGQCPACHHHSSFLQVSPSDSTLKREFSLDAVAMTTVLTKTSFCGGGWLTQKLRVLGKGVHSDE